MCIDISPLRVNKSTGIAKLADVLEYFELLVYKFGSAVVREDKELIKRMYRAFDREIIDDIIGLE